MIKLEVEQYCQNCPEFEPVVDSTALFINEGDVVRRETTVTCKHRERCINIFKHIAKI